MLFTVDGTFVVQLINFAVFFALVTWLFIKPVGRAIAERRSYIDGVVADYERYARQVDQLRGAAEARRAAARREADAALAAARAQTTKDVEAINADYAGRAAAIIEEAQATVAGEMAQARASEERLVRELAADMVDRALAAGAR